MAFDLNNIFAAIKTALDMHINEMCEATLDSHHRAYDHTLLDSSALRETVRWIVGEIAAPLIERIAALEEKAQPPGLSYTVESALTQRINRLEELLGCVFTVPPAKMDYLPEGLPDFSDAFERAIIGAIENNADDAVEALATGDCSGLVDDGVAEAVKRVIENGDFSIEFNNARRRY